MILKAEDLAYIAGVIDSDGYIGLTKNVGRGNNILFDLKIIINQTQPEAINLIREIFDGNCEIVKGKNLNWKDIYRWHIQSRKDVKIFLEAILPYLRIKKEQAKIVIEYCNIREKAIKENGGNRKYTYSGIEKIMYEKVKKLNQTGVKL